MLTAWTCAGNYSNDQIAQPVIMASTLSSDHTSGADDSLSPHALALYFMTGNWIIMFQS